MLEQKIAEEPEPDVGDIADDAVQVPAFDAQERRAELDSIKDFIVACTQKAYRTARVQYELDMTLIAAMQRAKRMFNSDIAQEDTV